MVIRRSGLPWGSQALWKGAEEAVLCLGLHQKDSSHVFSASDYAVSAQVISNEEIGRNYFFLKLTTTRQCR